MTLQEIKDYLHISHDYDDATLTLMISQSEAYLTRKVPGIVLTEPSEAELLKERIRYAYYQVLEEFEDAFLSEITDLQLHYACKE